MKKTNGERKLFSIKFHIFATMLALAIFMISILWIMQSLFMTTIYKFTKESDIRRAANLISENIESEEINSLISQVAIEYALCAKLVDFKGDGVVELHDKHFLDDCILHKISDYNSLLTSWYNEALENGGEYTQIFPRDSFRDFNYNDDSFEGNVPESKEQENCVISVRVIQTEDGKSCMLILNASVEPMHATIRVIRIILIFVSVIFFVFSIIVSFLLSRGLSRPIEKITKSAKELQGGDYNVRFVEEGPIETRELAKTLNTTTEQLDRLDKLQKELIANISHDLRTPLTMISGYSEVMRDIPGENTPENMQVIIDETARLNSLVNDLLDVSKLQSGKQAFNMQKISLTKAVEDTVKRYDKLTAHTGYRISFLHDREIFVLADETRLLQVIYNLVNNAINYTGDDKCVTIRQDVLDDVVRISIIDTGEGISEENLPLIWDRYYKVDKVHKRAVLGTGLGLSIVKNILLLHNSRFGVSSEIGKGSTFWFEFKITE